jgi:hypothetical protein
MLKIETICGGGLFHCGGGLFQLWWWWTVSKVNMLLKLATQTPLLMTFLHPQERAFKIHYHGAGYTSDTLTVID